MVNMARETEFPKQVLASFDPNEERWYIALADLMVLDRILRIKLEKAIIASKDTHLIREILSAKMARFHAASKIITGRRLLAMFYHSLSRAFVAVSHAQRCKAC